MVLAYRGDRSVVIAMQQMFIFVFNVDMAFLFIGLDEGFQMRWCTISAKEKEKCNDFKTEIPSLVSQANLPPVTFSCVRESNAVDCMAKIQSDQADLITLDGGEILTAGKQTF